MVDIDYFTIVNGFVCYMVLYILTDGFLVLRNMIVNSNG